MADGQNADGGQYVPLVANSGADELRKAFKEALDAQAKSGVGSWYGVLFTTGGSLGSFFAGFTLSIVSSTANSDQANDKEAGRHAAISSLLFVLTVLVCTACGLGYAFHKETIDGKMNDRNGTYFGKFTSIQLFMSAFSIAMQEVVLAAVLFFFLTMRAYAKVTGWVGIGFTIVCMAFAVGVWALQTFQELDWMKRVRSYIGL